MSKPSLQPFKSDPFTFDTKPVMPSPTSNVRLRFIFSVIMHLSSFFGLDHRAPRLLVVVQSFYEPEQFADARLLHPHVGGRADFPHSFQWRCFLLYHSFPCCQSGSSGPIRLHPKYLHFHEFGQPLQCRPQYQGRLHLVHLDCL